MESTLTKICKECGQPFVPINPRQVYCTRTHTRPCPICGKPVVIKYFSDPTPKCAECKTGKPIKQEKPIIPIKPKKQVTFNEGDTVASIYDTSITFVVEYVDENTVHVLDQKNLSQREIALADVTLVD